MLNSPSPGPVPANRVVVPSRSASASWAEATNPMNRWFRRQVHRRLRGLDGGRLLVSDAVGTATFGAVNNGCVDLTCEITVHRPRFYQRVVLGGSLGAAQAYAEGDWDCSDITAVFRLFVRNLPLLDTMEGGLSWLSNLFAWFSHRRNANNRQGSRRNIIAHYDLGNEFFELFLDSSLTYSSAVFATEGTSLEEGQREKLDRVCRKLGLCPHHHLLEIGTGWGSFALHAARHYGCRVTTTTISEEQFEKARARVRAAGLAERIDVRKVDYRDLQGRFDRIASIEMIEAVGHEYLPVFLRKCADLLAADGLMVLQGITMPDQRFDQYLKSSDFIRSQVFPGSCCPSLTAILKAMAVASDFRVIHLEEFGPHYARTLAAWRRRFGQQIEAVRNLGFDEAFIRQWRYYLSYCEAGFEERYLGTVQLALAKPGFRGAVGEVLRLDGDLR